MAIPYPKKITQTHTHTHLRLSHIHRYVYVFVDSYSIRTGCVVINFGSCTGQWQNSLFCHLSEDLPICFNSNPKTPFTCVCLPKQEMSQNAFKTIQYSSPHKRFVFFWSLILSVSFFLDKDFPKIIPLTMSSSHHSKWQKTMKIYPIWPD